MIIITILSFNIFINNCYTSIIKIKFNSITYYCMARMLMRGYKHPVFNLSASQYGTNPFYLWESMKKDIKTSILLDEQSDDDSGWNEFFYNFTFPK